MTPEQETAYGEALRAHVADQIRRGILSPPAAPPECAPHPHLGKMKTRNGFVWSPVRDAVRSHLSRENVATVPEMAEATGYGRDSVRTAVRALYAMGHIQKAGRRPMPNGGSGVVVWGLK